MATKPGFLDYVAAAFNARPFGMFVAPNWLGIAAVGLLGLGNPGVWVLGAGLELGYLLLLATNRRFQRLVEGMHQSGARGDWDRKVVDAVQHLTDKERRRYDTFAARCRSILDLQRQTTGSEPQGLQAQAEGLGRLSWMYLRLLLAQHAIINVLHEAERDDTDDLSARRESLQNQIDDESVDAELRRSLSGQVEIIDQRIARRSEAARKLAFIDAELIRIEQQAELIREQAALSTDPEVLSRRIDEIATTLGSTAEWIRNEQQVFGAMDDLLSGAPPAPIGSRAKESQ
jgi:hypothetical protein